MKKPNIVWAFLFFAVPQQSLAGFYENQIKPVQERAFDSKSQQILFTGLAGTMAANTQDAAARDRFGNNQVISKQSSKLGDEFGTFLVGPAIAVGQMFWDSDNGFSHARGLVYSTAVTHLLKETIRRERPDSHNTQSMPSGHSSSSFTTATSLSYAYGWKMAAVAYPVATFVALSRVSDDVHWLSDTVAGAVIGIWMGRASFYSVESISSSNADRTQPVVVPIITADRLGFNLELSF